MSGGRGREGNKILNEEVGLFVLLRPLFVESRVYFEPELHSEYPIPLYIFF